MVSVAESIHIRGASRSLDVAESRVLFTFGSGRLGYDCVRCGAQCCRGYGYNLNPGAETLYQLETRPYLRFFVETVESASRLPMVRNCPPACFFLDQDGLCGIHAKHGYDAKPETWRLFPFNAFRLIADYLIVSPHAGLCPLAVLPAGQRSDNSAHPLLFEAMRSQGIGGRVTPCTGLIKDTDRLVELERAVVLASESHLQSVDSFPAFIDVQTALTREILNRTGARANSSDHGAPYLAATQIEHAARVFGIPVADLSRGEPDVHQTVVGMTSYLRSQLVFRAPERSEATTNVRYDIERVPNIILGVFMITQLAKRAGMASITFQTVLRCSTNIARYLISCLVSIL